MPRIQFTRDAKHYELGPADPKYRAGDVVDLPQRSADRWKARHAAVDAPAAAGSGLVETEERARDSDTSDGPRIVSEGRGRWNVLDADGKSLNDQPLNKADAEALLKSALADANPDPAASDDKVAAGADDKAD